MNWNKRKHPGERLVEWGAPAVLAGAAGWAALALGSANLPAGGAAAAVLGLGVLAMGRASGDEHGLTMPAFALESLGIGVDDDELLLDDPIREISAESRVVALFEPAMETPGALVARIADYLGDRDSAMPATQGARERPVAGDAGAALHAALANIRASLR